MKNVLVFPASTEIGLEIHRAMFGVKDVMLFGADSIPNQHGAYVYSHYLNELIPFANDIEFLPKLREIVKKYRIDAIFPAHDDVITKIANHAIEIGCKIITS